MEEKLQRLPLAVAIAAATVVPTVVTGEMAAQPLWTRVLASAVLGAVVAFVALVILQRRESK